MSRYAQGSGGGAATVSATCAAVVAVALVAVTLIVKTPCVEGVPEMMPVRRSTVRPRGSAAAEYVAGSLVAAVVALVISGAGGVGIAALTSGESGPGPPTLVFATT